MVHDIDKGPETPLTQVTVIDEHTLTAAVTAGAPEGLYDLRVHTPYGSNTVSADKFEVYHPVELTGATGAVTETKGVTLPDDGIVPVKTTMSTGNRDAAVKVDDNQMEIEVNIEPGTPITRDDGSPYRGRRPVHKCTRTIQVSCRGISHPRLHCLF